MSHCPYASCHVLHVRHRHHRRFVPYHASDFFVTVARLGPNVCPASAALVETQCRAAPSPRFRTRRANASRTRPCSDRGQGRGVWRVRSTPGATPRARAVPQRPPRVSGYGQTNNDEENILRSVQYPRLSSPRLVTPRRALARCPPVRSPRPWASGEPSPSGPRSTTSRGFAGKVRGMRALVNDATDAICHLIRRRLFP